MSVDIERRAAAEAAVALVEPGMILGLGSGSAAAAMVRLLGERIRGGLAIRGGVATSSVTRGLAQAEGIPLLELDQVDAIDLTLDGTDEFDPRLNLTKGGGGALLYEKLVAASSRRLVILCEAKKQVSTLGAFPLPVEVAPFGRHHTARRIEALGATTELRRRPDGAPFVTDGGHLILDCRFGAIADPPGLAAALDRTVGVMEHGLFVGLAERVLMGRGSAVEVFVR